MQNGAIDVKKLYTLEPRNKIEDFVSFCDNQIEPATKELMNLSDAQRKHLQKLVYVNLANRFDSLVDNILIWLSRNDTKLQASLVNSLKDEFLTKKEFFEIALLREKSYGVLLEKIEDMCRSEFLRENHAKKLNRLLDTIGWEGLSKPFVNKKGIIQQTVIANKTCPNTVVGFADWLYSRRNSVVHGNGTKHTSQDIKRLRETYKLPKIPLDIKLSLQSVSVAITYYKGLLEKVESLITKP